MVVLRLLGEVVARVDGHRVGLGPARQRCVLAALAVDAGRVVPVDRLVERVWGPAAAPRARSTLRSYISRLRQALEPAAGVAIRQRSGGYVLVADEAAVDLHRFRQLCAEARDRSRAGDVPATARACAEALELWRGEALAGLGGEWAEAERDVLERERLAARHDLADARLRLGQGPDLVAELAARTAEHPLDERVAGQYVLALHQAGRTADALAHYRHLRERLAGDLGTDPGPALQELHRSVLNADPALPAAAVAPAMPPVTPGGPPVPLQLPAAPGPFTGRAAELAELDRVLVHPDPPPGGTGAATIAVISGTGGIGKTWLALAWANREPHRFPDGQLTADLRGFSPDTPKQAAGVLGDFLAALGVDRDHHPHDLDARAALYRTHTTGRRMLILLDNAATADQVTPLLPGGHSCTVLITSRNRLPALPARHGAHPLHLDVLTDTDARTLLHSALGTTRTTAANRAVTELIALCGGFPLALGLIAARVRGTPDLLHDTVTDLRELGLDALDSDDPDTSLPAVLSWSLRHLADRHRTAFALLGTAPGPDVDLPAAASLIGLSPRDTRTALHALVDASLATHAPGGRYALHDLVRAYAAATAHDHLPEPVRQAALERVVDFYRHTAHAADRLLSPNRTPIRLDPPVPGAHPHPLPDRLAALAWLDTHRPHLLAAQRTAAEHQRHRAAWHLAWTLHTFQQRRGHRHDALTAWRTAVDAAAHLPDHGARVLAHRLLGHAHAELGQHEEAVEHLHRALALAEHHRDPSQQAHTHHALSTAWERRGDDRRALEHARHALDLYRTLDQPVREAVALNAVGWHSARLGDYDAARDHCEAALTLHRLHPSPECEANTLDSLGFIAHDTGRHHQATHHYRQALVLLRTLGSTTQAATILDRLGHPHAALGQHEQARAVWREALELYRRLGRDADAERVRRQLDDLDRATAGPRRRQGDG
ncbi:BTAD domain-containing putative transcriptional regulator [Saccharothrix sp. Mg75]|uniref:AfsR/SARP family transcriptional regulator n=1 Tax=Saccharothrix sp. Mg75 TaxID=3445357 RepID=UPI003EED0A6C